MAKPKKNPQKSNNKRIPLIILGGVVLLTVLILVYQYRLLSTAALPNTPACTEEAKLCADGSTVVRSGADCEFAPCPRESQIINVYFNNTNLNPNTADCNLVFPSLRSVSGVGPITEFALRELFKGPTEAERAAGYSSWFSSTTQNILLGLGLADGTAYVNLRDIRTLLPNVSASCGSAEFLAEINSTLQQFSEINKVIIALNGQPADFYEWVQIGCTAENNFCETEPFQELNTTIEEGNVGRQIEKEGSTTEADKDAGGSIFIEKLPE